MSEIEESPRRDWKTLPLVPADFVCDSLGADSPVELTSSWLAVNLYRGCSFGCTYCFRYRWHPDSDPTQVISITSAFDLLRQHPSFSPNSTPITANVSSTDPLHPRVRESTIAFAELLDSYNLRNPFGIVSKGLLTMQDAQRLANLRSLRPVFLPSYSAMPSRIEPIPRRRRIEAMVNARKVRLPLIVSYKPIVEGWNDGTEQIQDVMEVSSLYADAIITGGLRLDSAIAASIQDSGEQLPFPIPNDWGEKVLPAELQSRIEQIHRSVCPTIPLYSHTSCAVSFVMEMANYNALRTRNPLACSVSCPSRQVDRCDN